MVFDYVPLIHMDTRTIGKTSSCKREDLDTVDIAQICSIVAESERRSCGVFSWVTQKDAC